MVRVEYDTFFVKRIGRLKDARLKERIKKQISKIIESPEIGKPMRYARKGTREVYVPPFRLSYAYHAERDTIEFLDLYHKDEQ